MVFCDGQTSTFGRNMTTAPVFIKSSETTWYVLHAQGVVVALVHDLRISVLVVELFCDMPCTSSPPNYCKLTFMPDTNRGSSNDRSIRNAKAVTDDTCSTGTVRDWDVLSHVDSRVQG